MYFCYSLYKISKYGLPLGQAEGRHGDKFPNVGVLKHTANKPSKINIVTSINDNHNDGVRIGYKLGKMYHFEISQKVKGIFMYMSRIILRAESYLLGAESYLLRAESYVLRAEYKKILLLVHKILLLNLLQSLFWNN